MSTLAALQALVLVLTLATEAFTLPYRSYTPRSVPGRIRSSTGPETLEDYLTTYLDMFQQRNPQLQQQIPYGLPEYEPTYQEGYISRRPQISREKLAALLPYLSQTDLGDYSYDYNAPPSNSYTDEEGTWYDDAATPEYVPLINSRDKNNQQAALIQLFLDHLANKYSLEDLETLERQAAMEDNTENQLQSLMPQKKSSFPILGSHTTARKIIGYPVRQGQKEEPIMVPASSVRRPVFTRASPLTEKQDRPGKVGTTASTVDLHKDSNGAATRTEHEEEAETSVGNESKDDTSLKASTTMEPAIRSAYDAFKTYLDQERSLRQAMDEGYHTPQKRFVSDPDSLTQQLANLKKTVT